MFYRTTEIPHQTLAMTLTGGIPVVFPQLPADLVQQELEKMIQEKKKG